jgi:hypothetical protein
MTEKAKPKIGRPATGRNPLVSFRAPQHLCERVAAAARYLKRPASEIYREALFLGLEHLHGERVERGKFLRRDLRPEHNAEVHEAGHAVVAWLNAEERGENPLHAVDHIALKQRGAGHIVTGNNYNWGIEFEVRVDVAGAVAQAKHTGLSFEDVWSNPGCRGDRRNVERRQGEPFLDDAVRWVKLRFREEDTWEALMSLARDLVHGNKGGFHAWRQFNGAREWARGRGERAAKYFDEVDDEPFEYPKVAKKKRVKKRRST